MRLSFALVYTGALLGGLLTACQPADQLQQLTPDPTANRTGNYLFTGNPGIYTDGIEDITGTMTGTIDGQTVTYGLDKSIPVRARGGYNVRQTQASVLSVQVNSEQYSISLFFNGPFEAGRSYRVYNAAADNGEGKLDPYIAAPFIRIPAGQYGTDIIDLATPDEKVTITAITPEYIDIELLFTLSKPGAVQEKLTMRVKNVIDENRNLRKTSETEPFWDYTNASRQVGAWGYTPRQGNTPGQPTTTQVQVEQRGLTTPVSDVSYEGKTESFTNQVSLLYQLKQPTEQTHVELSLTNNPPTGNYKQVEIVWSTFTGVGTYTGEQANVSFTNNQNNVGYWRIQPARLANANTKWQVDVQKVTPDVIEGTYTITDAPVYQKNGSIPVPASASVSGKFRVIYPR